jgi:quinol monooxygenase YgiN
MAVTVLIRGRLRDEPGAAQALHDEVTGATKELAKGAGDTSHRTFRNPADPRDFLGIDEWVSAEAVGAFSSDPRIQDFFGRLFESTPEVTIWESTGWNEW